VHELSRDQPKTTKELLDTTTWHASGEEAVRAIFVQGDGKMVPMAAEGHHPKPLTKALREAPKATKMGKSGAPSRSRLLSAMTMMTTRNQTVSMRSTSWSLSVSARLDSRMITSRNFLK
jgi:hypothetical protein